MIIVSQDKKTIVNFDDVTKISINSPIGTNDGEFKITAENILTAEILGYYKTEKRAKEVLGDIVNEYAKYLQLNGGPAILQGQIDIQPNIFNIPKVYEMPKE